MIPPVTTDGDTALTSRARVRFVARPSSMQALRRLLAEVSAGWGSADRRHDVLLVATELATNAMLHSGGSFFEVRLSASETTFRVEVEDSGEASAQAIGHRSDMASGRPTATATQAMTGRGLLLVSALASAWGVDDLPRGIRVWADVAVADHDDEPVAPCVRAAPATVDPSPVGVIELRGCPPELLLAHDTNLADTARELRLLGATHGDQEMVVAAERVADVVRMSATSWDAARLVAHQAVQDGRPEVDIATAPAQPQDVPRRISVLREAVALAETMMERGLLMTAPASEAVREWRDWVEAEMVEQVTEGREPRPFAKWRAARRG